MESGHNTVDRHSAVVKLNNSLITQMELEVEGERTFPSEYIDQILRRRCDAGNSRKGGVTIRERFGSHESRNSELEEQLR